MERLENSVAIKNPEINRMGTKPSSQIQDTAREFETMFLSHVVEEMVKTVDIGTFGGGEAEEKWRSFFASAIAEEISGQGTTGISQSIEAAIKSYKNAKD